MGGRGGEVKGKGRARVLYFEGRGIRGGEGGIRVSAGRVEGAKYFSMRLTTTRDRNLQFRGAVSTGFLNFRPWIFCPFSRFTV